MGNCCGITLFQFQCEAALITSCMECTFGPATYGCTMKKNLRVLKTGLQDLEDLKSDVEDKVEMAELEAERLKQVDTWLSTVKKEIDEGNKLVADADDQVKLLAAGGCCRGGCGGYILGREVSKKLEVVNGLINKGKFEHVAGKRPAPAVELPPTEPTLGLGLGTQSMIEKLWSQLQEQKVGIVGLFGLGGVGKSTVLEHIHNKYVKSFGEFDLILYIKVSRNHAPEKVQNEIGRIIGCGNVEDWKKQEQHKKRADIYRLLKRKKFVLLLDDLWEPVNLNEVGIPMPHESNLSKLVFSTRDQEICTLMKAHSGGNKVKCLREDEAWNLFKNNVGEEILSLDPDIPDLAKLVAKKCGGLPLALKAIGSAMSCMRTTREWNEAIDTLRKSASEFKGMKKVLAFLKFSYDNLSNSVIKRCFLYCALFPEDSSIHKDELIYKWMCEGLLKDCANDVDKTLNKGYSIIGTLVRASLLEDISGYVKMHDVIREMALWVARESEETKENFVVESGSLLTELPDIKNIEDVKRMSLMANDIENLEESPSCPNLLTLLLNNNRLKMISQDFFKSMSNLQVLDLSKNEDLNQLPSGISELLSLQYLDLSGTGIRELPIQLKDLVKLLYLNLEHTTELSKISKNVISNFSKMRVLRLYDSGVCRSILVGDNEHLGRELKCLHLDMLTLTIHSESSFKKFINSSNLVRYTQVLCLDGLSFPDVSYLSCMESSYSLTINSCDNVKYNLDVLSKSVLNRLTSVEIHNCPNLMDLTWLIFAPKLKTLSVNSCSNLKEIIEHAKWGGVADVEQMNPFASLEGLVLTHLPQLESMHGGEALPFPFLRKIEVLDCQKLKKLPLNSSSVPTRNIVIAGEEAWWSDVKMEDATTKDSFRPYFRPHK